MPDSHASEWNFVAIWEFRVSPQATARFEEAYGADGVWAGFFRGAEGFVRTELVHDAYRPERYLTLDFWTSRESYENFREKFVHRRFQEWRLSMCRGLPGRT